MGTGRGGVERGGVEAGLDDVEDFIRGKQAKSQSAEGKTAPPRLTSSPSSDSIMIRGLTQVWGALGDPLCVVG